MKVGDGLSSELTDDGWDTLEPKLSKECLDSIQTFGFPLMTPVQAVTIPLFLQHKDVIVEACTGSGKTLAFLVPMIEMLLRPSVELGLHDVGAIVISPTRELAEQTGVVAKQLIEHHITASKKLSLQVMIGGTSVDEDAGTFRRDGGHVVVATPGRLNQIIHIVPEFNTRNLEVLIMDEADRLLHMGFRPAIDAILSRLPKQRRTGIFSATQTGRVKELARAGMRNPVVVSIRVEEVIGQPTASTPHPLHSNEKEEEYHNEDEGENAIEDHEQVIPASLENKYMVVPAENKLNTLVHLLSHRTHEKTIVYFLTCACVNYFWKVLQVISADCTSPLHHVPIYSIHGKVPQKKRSQVLSQFRGDDSQEGTEGGVLMATDVAARGLDIPWVDCVIQYDAPLHTDTFVHRVGRTARMGRRGQAIMFLMPHETSYTEYLRVKKVPIEKWIEPLEKKKEEGRDEDVLPIVRNASCKSREFLDKGVVAFVSFARAYREHLIKHVFAQNALPYSDVAVGMGLVHLPNMPELRSCNLSSFHAPTGFLLDNVPYDDPTREHKRKAKLRARKNSGQDSYSTGHSTETRRGRRAGGLPAWSKKKEIKAKKKRRKNKRQIKKERAMIEKVNAQKKEQEALDEHLEWQALAQDHRLLKKLKRGTISQTEYDSLTEGPT